MAKAVLAAGDRLVATARNTKDLQPLVEQLGDRVRAVALDVTRPEAARAAAEVARTAFGRLDVVVNNAGYANVNSIEDVAGDDFRAQIETNFFGVVNVMRAALPLLREQRSGHIIQISSIGGRGAGDRGVPFREVGRRRCHRTTGDRPSVEKIARTMGLSPRTLQRRLGELGTSYQAPLDDVRRDASRRLLANTDLDASEIAFLLGFEELNSFSRPGLM